MSEAIGPVLALGAAVGASPIPLIAIVAVLFSARSKVNGLVFLAVWCTGLAALTTGAYLLAVSLDIGSGDAATDRGVQWARLALGIVLISAAAIKWRRRPGPTDEPTLPGWMSGLDRLSVGRTVLLAGGLSLNPKNLMLAGAAAVTLAESELTTTHVATGIAGFAVLGSAPVATAVVYRLVGGDRATVRLERLRAWLARHNTTVVAALFATIGAILIAQGLGLLS
ncbi:MAG: GAP family protein [Acidimicrobiia bacterium]|nr:GAP family protein [Acidimicrobiia bacterium]